ncbi:MAG: PqqD family protein [Thermofilaceae archaeon]|nr:PqqD family protein [Thermofilaceae archaeon]MCX8181287.1 PqqD family protein [Thermofilaceae archaeon]MDW8004630.1 PqqD family protein [Thermofilaceae archaeon]
MPLFKRSRKVEPPPIPLEVILASKPIRNPTVTWEKNEKGEVVLTIKLEPSSKPGLFSGFVKEPTERKIVLDQVGGFVWELLDGEKTVNNVIEHVAKQFKLHRREAQTSLLAYLQMLSERGLVALIAPSPSTEHTSSQTGS